ncbi:glutathione hydrolase 6 isoform X3 [Leucoraja erinacea]|nr:glutathione hydrolase 6 isoform X3 [Leucoraja erinacea]
MLSRQKRNSCLRVTASMTLLGVGLYFGFHALWLSGLESPEAGDVEGLHLHHHEHGVYHQAAVITDSEICSGFAKETLLEGGNAVDAGVVAMLCLGVVHPHSTGIGGVLTAIFHNGTSGATKALNALPSERLKPGFGAPLLLQGLRLLHHQHGSLPWARLPGRPAKLAREGFAVDEILARAVAREAAGGAAGLCPFLCGPGPGQAPKGVGAQVTNEKLATVLEEVVRKMGGDLFPETLARDLARDLSLDPQSLAETLRHQRAVLSSPLVTELDDFTLAVPPAPSAGEVLIQLVGRARRLGLSWASLANDVNTSSTYRHLLNAAQQVYQKLLGLPGSPRERGGGRRSPETAPGGSHVLVVDGTGNILAMVGSLNSTFGAKTFSPSTGSFLSDFTGSRDSGLVYWACPGLLRSKAGEDYMVLVSSGGADAPFVSAQAIISVVYLERSASDALAGPRLYLHVGRQGAPHKAVSGLKSDSEIFAHLSREVPGLELVNGTAEGVTSTLVESHLGHKRAYAHPQTCAFVDGY